MEPSRDDIAAMFDSVSLGAPENAVGFVLWRMTHRFQRGVEQALRPLDLTHLQFTVLALAAWMSREGRVVVQAELARFGDIHPMQVSLVLKALERKGMVRRAKAQGAAKAVTITHQGLQSLREALPLTRAVQQKLFGDEGLPGGSLLDQLLRVERKREPPNSA